MIEDFLHLPPVSLTTVANLKLRISPRVSEKIRNDPNGILSCLGETDSWKNQKSKISWHCPFKQFFTCIFICWTSQLFMFYILNRYLFELEHMQQYCMQNPWIAYNADNVLQWKRGWCLLYFAFRPIKSFSLNRPSSWQKVNPKMYFTVWESIRLWFINLCGTDT